MEKRWLVFIDIEDEEEFDENENCDFLLCNDAELAYLLLTKNVKCIYHCKEG